MNDISDEELANALVEREILNRIDLRPPHSGSAWELVGGDVMFLTIDGLVNDPRVAMACIEKMDDQAIACRIGSDRWNIDDDYTWLRDCRAICQAFVEATK